MTEEEIEALTAESSDEKPEEIPNEEKTVEATETESETPVIESPAEKQEDIEAVERAIKITEEEIEALTVESSAEKAEETPTEEQTIEATGAESEALVAESPDEKTDDIQIDEQAVDGAEEEEEVGGPVAESPTAISFYKKFFSGVFSTDKIGMFRAYWIGIFVSVVMMIVAIILLKYAAVERKSAREALARANITVESIKRKQDDSLKARKEIINTQIQGREQMIDALLLTRHGLELEQVKADEEEVKEIIGVFMDDIDARIAKIKDEITVLKNKLEKSD